MDQQIGQVEVEQSVLAMAMKLGTNESTCMIAIVLIWMIQVDIHMSGLNQMIRIEFGGIEMEK